MSQGYHVVDQCSINIIEKASLPGSGPCRSVRGLPAGPLLLLTVSQLPVKGWSCPRPQSHNEIQKLGLGSGGPEKDEASEVVRTVNRERVDG